MNRLKNKYQTIIVPELKKELGLTNSLALPALSKVTINVGISANKREDKYLELVAKTLQRISGQKPVFTLARQAISAFKIREGNVVGATVTLRGNKMYDFVDKLINITLPRVRDFRGLSYRSIDQQGNLNLGFKEHIAFAEIDSSEVEMLHGLQLTVNTTAKNKTQGQLLLEKFGFPFKKENIS
ncbi:MAG TPA: 50S ribosomal protein L5 [bacterium]|nr:50S ribosomal protein L5 [bacterium]HPL95890.1 50S ribosomal protein L5 [bacterium]